MSTRRFIITETILKGGLQGHWGIVLYNLRELSFEALTCSLCVRVMLGYLLSLLVLGCFLLVVATDGLAPDQTYGLVLLLVAVLSFGATGLQIVLRRDLY